MLFSGSTVPIEVEDETGRLPTCVGFGMRVSQCFGSLFEKKKRKSLGSLLCKKIEVHRNVLEFFCAKNSELTEIDEIREIQTNTTCVDWSLKFK